MPGARKYGKNVQSGHLDQGGSLDQSGPLDQSVHLDQNGPSTKVPPVSSAIRDSHTVTTVLPDITTLPEHTSEYLPWSSNTSLHLI